jgi:hypothetical protein
MDSKMSCKIDYLLDTRLSQVCIYNVKELQEYFLINLFK